MDARIRYTKHVIKEQMAVLLGEMDISKITVKELCRRAEINRATFYKYYDNPYDLMDKMMQELLDELEEKIVTAEPKSFQDVFYVVLADIQENFTYYQLLFSADGDEKFRKKLFSICYGDNIRTIRLLFPDMPQAEQEWLYYFVANGCNGILMDWIKNGRRESIEQLVQFAGDLILTINTHLSLKEKQGSVSRNGFETHKTEERLSFG